MPLPELEIPSPTTSEGTRSPTPKGPAERADAVTRGKRASVVGAGGYASKNRVVQVALGAEPGSVSGTLGLSPRSADLSDTGNVVSPASARSGSIGLSPGTAFVRSPVRFSPTPASHAPVCSRSFCGSRFTRFGLCGAQRSVTSPSLWFT
eukprot:COSAG04_NODE_7359_length_1141_cov_1.137236_1_plen_149_part_10